MEENMGGVKGRKQKKLLKRRLEAYAAQGNLPGYRKPGSNKK
jgi:hypothetical protein